jgi:5-methyltetrahydropteroyltriglutamate--homocysteine methyltransferase
MHESQSDSPIVKWLAFATQKLSEGSTLARGANEGRESIRAALAVSDMVQEERRASALIHDPAVQQRLAATGPEMKRQGAPYEARSKLQREAFGLPLLPTTTIGSFPQTAHIR